MGTFGKVGVEHIDDEETVLQLQRLYWFTIEFGLIKQNVRKVYGAGICSSFGETLHSLSDEVEVRPFNIEEVIESQVAEIEIKGAFSSASQRQIIETTLVRKPLPLKLSISTELCLIHYTTIPK